MQAPANLLSRLTVRYAAFACRHPHAFVAAMLLSVVPALFLAARLELRTDFKDLLPADKPSVVELERVANLLAGAAGPSLTVAIQGDDLPAMKRFADALAGRLAQMGPETFAAIDLSASKEREFFANNRFLYADRHDLQAVRDALHREVLRVQGLDLGLDDDAEDLRALERRLGQRAAKADRFPDGYYVGEDGRLLAVFATLASGFSDVDQMTAVVDRVRAAVDALEPARFHPSLRVTLTGEAVTGVEEYREFRGDLLLSSALCVSLVLLSIVIFYGRLRSLPIIGLTLLCGVAWTFGLARLSIGYLNSSTAFLGSIIAGNGVNFGIVLLARYFEERRGQAEPADAMATAVATTAPATLGAALAAGIAYGSLSLTSFRGFNQFGVIGGCGMALCWLATYGMIPPLALAFDHSPWFARRSGRPWRDLYSAPFAALVARAPRALIVLGVLGSLAGGALGIRHLLGQPFEYYFGNLKNKERVGGKSVAAQLDERVSRGIRTEGTDGMAIIANHARQVPFLRHELLRRRDGSNRGCADRPDAARPQRGCSPIGDVATLDDLLPSEQAEKLTLLREIRRLADRAKPLLDPEERALVEQHRPPDELRRLRAEDLPKKLLDRFRERDGTLGRILYVSHASWVSVWHGEHLIAFAEAVEDLPLPDGDRIRGSGRAVIFADMVRSISADGRGAVLASLTGVILLVIALFGVGTGAAAVLATLSGGVALLLGYVGAWDIKLNFLNFVAIPITIGVGADYAINMVKRLQLEAATPVDEVVRTTGGAIVLCSVTTVIGYASLLFAQSLALNSFGLLAMMGEITCIVVAILVLPAAFRARPGSQGHG